MPAEADRWLWSWPAADDDHLAAVPGLGAAAAGAKAAARATVAQGQLTLGLPHTDPAPTAFQVDGRAGWGDRLGPG